MEHTFLKINLCPELSSDCGGRGFDQEQQHVQRLPHRSVKVSPAASGPAAPHQDRPDPTTNPNQHPQSTQKRTGAHWYKKLLRVCFLTLDCAHVQVMIVVGGQAPKAIRSVECYDFQEDRWYQVADLPSRRCRAGPPVLKALHL